MVKKIDKIVKNILEREDTVLFKSNPENWKKETNGTKPNTVRVLDEKDDRFKRLRKGSAIFVALQNTKTRKIKIFEITDYTEFAGRGIVSYNPEAVKKPKLVKMKEPSEAKGNKETTLLSHNKSVSTLKPAKSEDSKYDCEGCGLTEEEYEQHAKEEEEYYKSYLEKFEPAPLANLKPTKHLFLEELQDSFTDEFREFVKEHPKTYHSFECVGVNQCYLRLGYDKYICVCGGKPNAFKGAMEAMEESMSGILGGEGLLGKVHYIDWQPIAQKDWKKGGKHE